MTLFKLSLSNMKKSIKDYAIYFFTLVLGVAIFYIFNAIETQSAMLKISKDTREVIELMTSLISGVSVFIAFVLGFLIVYASRFLMKRRNKEFGLYLLLGMGKRKVSMLLFLETLIIGLVSLAVGLLVGLGLSQLTSLLVANMFEADMSSYQFVFSSQAFFKTCLYFAIIYLVVILFNTITIGKCRLIDLFQRGRKSETVKMKNPWLSVLVFLIAAAGLAYAYHRVVAEYDELYGKDIFICIAIGCVCTLLIFWSVSGMLFRVISSIKSVYYKGLNSFIVRQMSSRVNTNVVSISVICIMLFFTICILSGALSIRNGLNDGLKKYARADVNLSKSFLDLTEADLSEDEKVQYAAWNDASILEIYKGLATDIEPYFSEYEDAYVYGAEDLTVRDSLGDAACAELLGEDSAQADSMEAVMAVSDYNRIAKLYGNETISLEEDEYAVIANYEDIVKYRNQVLQAGKTITVYGQELKPGVSACVDGNLEIGTQAMETGIFIVPDSVVEGQTPKSEYMAANYNTEDKAEIDARNETLEEIQEWFDAQNLSNPRLFIGINTKANIMAASVGLGAIASFLGIYIGFIFLISGAAILALKELSESTDNVERYRMLRKLGVDRKMMNHALFSQMGLFFLFPLALAIVHSVFGLMFCKKMLKLMGTGDMGISILMTAIIMVVIYGGYFLITYLSGKKIINE